MHEMLEALRAFYRSADPRVRFALVGLLVASAWAGVAYGFLFLGPLLFGS